jgi:hypothetical protein
VCHVTSLLITASLLSASGFMAPWTSFSCSIASRLGDGQVTLPSPAAASHKRFVVHVMLKFSSSSPPDIFGLQRSLFDVQVLAYTHQRVCRGLLTMCEHQGGVQCDTQSASQAFPVACAGQTQAHCTLLSVLISKIS